MPKRAPPHTRQRRAPTSIPVGVGRERDGRQLRGHRAAGGRPREKPSPSALTRDEVDKLSSAELKRELEARDMRAVGPRGILAARLRAAVGQTSPEVAKKPTTEPSGTGKVIISNFGCNIDRHKVAFGTSVVFRVDPEEPGAVE